MKTAPGKSAKPRPIRRFIARLCLKAMLFLFLYWALLPPFLIPVEGRVSSHFFPRFAPEGGFPPRLEMHRGMDFASAMGNPVFAAKSGRVKTKGWDEGYGNYLIVEHWLGFSTLYGHLSRIDIAEGALVLRGTRIGAVGTTGRSTGPHVHFELRRGGQALPAELFLLPDTLRRYLFHSIGL